MIACPHCRLAVKHCWELAAAPALLHALHERLFARLLLCTEPVLDLRDRRDAVDAYLEVEVVAEAPAAPPAEASAHPAAAPPAADAEAEAKKAAEEKAGMFHSDPSGQTRD